MNPFKIFSFVCMLGLMAEACKKEGGDTCKLRTGFLDEEGSMVVDIKYDSENRVSSFSTLFFPVRYMFDYSNPGRVIVGDGTRIALKYILGSNGLAKVKITYSYSEDRIYIDSVYCAYDAAGFITKELRTTSTYDQSSNDVHTTEGYPYIKEFIIANGNTVKCVEKDEKGHVSRNLTYEYYADKKSSQMARASLGFIGKTSTHLLKREIENGYNVKDYYYGFDMQRNVVLQQEKSQAESSSYSFEWDCK